MTKDTMSLLNLSNEVLYAIWVNVDPVDLAAISATCRTLHENIDKDNLLHRDIYARHWVSGGALFASVERANPVRNLGLASGGS